MLQSESQFGLKLYFAKNSLRLRASSFLPQANDEHLKQSCTPWLQVSVRAWMHVGLWWTGAIILTRVILGSLHAVAYIVFSPLRIFSTMHTLKNNEATVATLWAERTFFMVTSEPLYSITAVLNQLSLTSTQVSVICPFRELSPAAEQKMWHTATWAVGNFTAYTSRTRGAICCNRPKGSLAENCV